jgi:hypothetical protein
MSQPEPQQPVVELWVDDQPDGSQTVLLAGQARDGDQFFASFFQPRTASDQEDTNDVW